MTRTAEAHALTCGECGQILTATELYHLAGEHFHVFICERCHKIRVKLHTTYCSCVGCLRGEPKEERV